MRATRYTAAPPAIEEWQLRLDKVRIKEGERFDGKYLIRTSDDTLPAEDVALGYRQLVDIEEAFRTLKQNLEVRPVYHRLEHRIRAHKVLCWLALFLVRRRAGHRRELAQDPGIP